MESTSQNAGKTASPLVYNSVTWQNSRHTAWPMADDALAQEILDLLQQGIHYRQVKKGANEGQLP